MRQIRILIRKQITQKDEKQEKSQPSKAKTFRTNLQAAN
jgi:hypothetical protein